MEEENKVIQKPKNTYKHWPKCGPQTSAARFSAGFNDESFFVKMSNLRGGFVPNVSKNANFLESGQQRNCSAGDW